MRILVVSNGYPPRGRFGTEFYTRELVLGLRARGHELAVLHPERGGGHPRYTLEEVEEDGLPVHLLHNAGDARKRFEASYADPRVEEVFGELLARLRPDVVHFTYLLWGLSARLPSVARERGVPGVVTLTDYGLLCHRGQMFDFRLERCHGPHPPEVCARCIREPAPFDLPPGALRVRRSLVRALAAVGGIGRVVTTPDVARREETVTRALADAAALIAPTASLAAVFERGGVPSERMEVLPYAFDELAYREVVGSRPERARFGFFGQLAPHKGLATLVEAARLLEEARPGAAWEVVLHGAPSAGRHREYAPHVLAAAPARVVQGAPFGPDEAPGVLAGLTALVLPSEWDENAPLALLQARAAGVPVVASDVPGMREVCEPGVHGLLFPPGDARALAQALADVLDGRVERGGAPGLPVGLDEHLDRVEAIHRRAAMSPAGA